MDANAEKTIWEELGLPPPQFEDGEGPPLTSEDQSRLDAFLRKELGEKESHEVNFNIGRWKSWSNAATAALLPLYVNTMTEGEGPPLTENDLQVLKAYLRNELTDDEDEEVARKIEQWRSWRKASHSLRAQKTI